MNITLNQRRFLIVWILFHSFALFLNLIPIKGHYSSKRIYNTDGARADKETTTYLFTNNIQKDSFWPFVEYNSYDYNITKFYSSLENHGNPNYLTGTHTFTIHTYNGIFNSYDIAEFIFYILLGLSIVYIPKFWKNT